MGQQVTLTISAEDTASGVIAKVAEGLDKLGKQSEALKPKIKPSPEAASGWSQFSAGLETVSMGVQRLLTPMNLLTGAVGVGLVAAMRSAISSASEMAIEISRMQAVTGATVEEITSLQSAVDAMGGSSGALQRALFLMSFQIESGGAGLKRMGISVVDANDNMKDELPILREVADHLSGMTSSTKAATEAKQALGRGVGDLLPLLLKGSKGMDELGESGRKFGEEFGQRGVEDMRRFRGAVNEAHDAEERLKVTIVHDMVPALELMNHWVTSTLEAMRSVDPGTRRLIEGLVLAASAVLVLAAGWKILAGAWAFVANVGIIAWFVRLGAVTLALVTPVGAAATAITALVLTFATMLTFDVGGIRSKWGELFDYIGGKIQRVIDTFAFLHLAWEKAKGLVGLGSTPGVVPPEFPPRMAREAESEQKGLSEAVLRDRLAFQGKLIQSAIELAAATQTSEAAQVFAIKKTLEQRIAELDFQDQVAKDTESRAQTAVLRDEARKVANARIVQIYAQEQLKLSGIDEKTAEMRNTIQLVSAQANLAILLDSTEDAKRLVKDEYVAFSLSQAEYVQRTALLNNVILAGKKSVLAEELAIVVANQKLQEAEINKKVATPGGMSSEEGAKQRLQLATTTAKQILDIEIKGAADERDILNQNYALQREMENKQIAFIAEAEQRGLAQKIRTLEEWRAANRDNIKVVMTADAELFRTRQEGYDQDVRNAIDAWAEETKFYRSESDKRLAILAGIIEREKAVREQAIMNTASVLAEQARLAGDLDAAFSVGFAHAASSADDAFKAMTKSGADAYSSLKSGLSDYLFATITGAGKIGNIFVNLGKRILRSMTDTFAEILAKQIAMAAGFSFTGVLGAAGSATAQVAQWQAADGPISNIMALGTASNGATAAIGGMGQMSGIVATTFGSLSSLLLNFGSVVMAVMQVLVSVASGGALGGAGGIAGASSNLLSSLSTLGSVFSNFATNIMGGIANTLQNTFTALGAQQGAFAAGPAVGGGTIGMVGGVGPAAQFITKALPWIGAAYALYQMFSGQLTPLSGAISGAMIGTMIMPGIGTIIGGLVGVAAGFISKLFGSTPKAAISAAVLPFDRGNISNAIRVSVSGNALKSSQENALADQLIEILHKILQGVVSATAAMTKTLPPALAAELEASLATLETSGVEILGYTKFKGSKAGKKLVAFAENLPDIMIQVLSESLGFGDLDLKTLGGGKVGDAGKGFEAMLTAISSMSAIAKAAGMSFDSTSLTLAEFTERSVAYFQQFAKEGEAFIDTVKRMTEAIAGIISMQDSLASRIFAVSGDIEGSFNAQAQALQAMGSNIAGLVDSLTIAVASMASPEEVLAAANALLQAYDAAIQAMRQLQAELMNLRKAWLDAATFYADLSTQIAGLRGSAGDAQFFGDVLAGAALAWDQFSDVGSRISLFSTVLRIVATDVNQLNAAMPMLGQGFGIILQQIHELTNATEAVAALKELAGVINQGLSAAITGTQAASAAQRAAAQAAGSARISALERERDAIQRVSDTRLEALQQELDLANDWANILQSAKRQLADLFDLLAPTQPLTNLNILLEQFRTARSAFGAAPTPEGAEAVQDLARRLLDLATQVPGYDLPSLAFQTLATEIRSALEEIVGVAGTRRTAEAIQEEIKIINEQQTAQLAAINISITTANEALQAQLESISVSEQAQIASLQQAAAGALEMIRSELAIQMGRLAVQEAAAQAQLAELLGDKSFEQFIAEAQAAAVDLLRGIQDTLRDYLGAIIRLVDPTATMPSAATGMDYVPRTGPMLVHHEEAILNKYDAAQWRAGRGESERGAPVTIYAPVTVIASGEVDAKRLADQLENELSERVKWGRLKMAIAEGQRGQR